MPSKQKQNAVTAIGSTWSAKKATKSAVDKFEEQFAKDMGVSPSQGVAAYKVVSTGSLALDFALTIGGYPSGRIIELWGPEHAGKTTMAIIYCAVMQRMHPGQKVAWVDMEQTFDEKWATSLGLDCSNIWFFTPKTAEETADAVKRFVQSGLCSTVVLDSVGGMIARMEYEKEADEATVGLVAKTVTRMVKQCSPMAHTNGTSIVVINQVRSIIGATYGPDQDTSGGWALKHVTTIKCQIKRGQEIKVRIDGEEQAVGHEINVLVQKNKCGPKGKRAVLTLFNQATKKYGPVGIDVVTETVEFAIKYGCLPKEKPTSSYLVFPHNGERINGKAKAVEYAREHPDAVEDLRRRVLSVVADQVDQGSDDEMEIPDAAEFLKFDEVVRA